jgi:hypothetical protein
MNIFSSQTRANHSYKNMPMQLQSRRFLYNVPVKTPIPEQLAIPTTPIIPKVKWGEPTWFLLHTLSVKIKDSDFLRIRQELLDSIYSICTNLPCPTCSDHAKKYLDGINFNAIQTKDDLKKMLHSFHNSVNQRKGYPFFPYEELDTKYSLAITNNIIINFMKYYSDRSHNIKLVAGDLMRFQLCEILKKWFNANIHAFHP